MVIVITGILAAVAIARFSDRITFETRSFADQVRVALQYTQSVAVAQRRNACATVAASSLTLTQGTSFGAACSASVVNPATGAAFVLNTPSGVSLSLSAGSNPVTFDALGRTASGWTVTVTGDQAIQILVEQETGYVR